MKFRYRLLQQTTDYRSVLRITFAGQDQGRLTSCWCFSPSVCESFRLIFWNTVYGVFVQNSVPIIVLEGAKAVKCSRLKFKYLNITTLHFWSDLSKTVGQDRESLRFGLPGDRSRSQWPSGLRRGSAAARLLVLLVPIPPGSWMFVLCELYNQEKKKAKTGQSKQKKHVRKKYRTTREGI